MSVTNFSVDTFLQKVRENGLLILLSICINICGLALPIYTLQAYDRIIISQNFSTFFIITLGAFCFILLEFLFRILRSNLTSYYANESKHIEFMKAIRQFARIKPEKLMNISLAEKAELIDDLSKTNDFIYRQLFVALVDILFLFLFLAVIALLSPKLGLIIGLILSIFTLVAIKFNLFIIKKHNQRERSDERRLAGIISFLRSCFSAKTHANELLLLQKQDVTERKSVINTYKLSISLSSLYNFTTFSTQILIVAILVIGVLQVVAGQLTFGTLIAIIIIAGRLTNPIREMLTIWFKIANFIRSNKKISIFYKQFTRSYLKGNVCKKYPYVLNINNLSIRESVKSNKFAFSSLAIKLRLGESAVITNVNTHQRSLLKKLLIGSIVPDSGQIDVLGNPLYKLTSEQFYKSVGYITVEEQYINGTIMENITGGRDISNDDIEELCKLFAMKDEILKLEQGFQTNLNSNTLQELPMNLRVKILLVRAYLYRPKLVIVDMDEDYVDQELYQTIFKFLKKIRHTCALLIISNDLNLTMLGDYIYDAGECRYYNHDINHLTNFETI